MFATCSGFPPGGHPLLGGGGVGDFTTTPVGAEVASVVPSLFLARIRRRIVLPTSSEESS